MQSPILLLLMVLLAALLSTSLAGCGFSPPKNTDTAAPKYHADLEACSNSVPDAVDKHNAKTGLAWFTGGVTRWSAIDGGISTCMDQKGWGHARACTAEELRNGDRTPSLVVTAAGIQCSDPNKPS